MKYNFRQTNPPHQITPNVFHFTVARNPIYIKIRGKIIFNYLEQRSRDIISVENLKSVFLTKFNTTADRVTLLHLRVPRWMKDRLSVANGNSLQDKWYTLRRDTKNQSYLWKCLSLGIYISFHESVPKVRTNQFISEFS